MTQCRRILHLPDLHMVAAHDESTVTLWCILLETPVRAELHDACMALLTSAERERSARYLVPHAKLRFTAGRGALRAILANYLGCKPQEIQLEDGASGKPELRAPNVTARLHFNVTHADGLVLIAIAEAGPIGVDIESVVPIPDAEQIARQYFTRGERELLMSTSPMNRPRKFLQLWTRKEAVVKGMGEGLRLLDTRFDVRADSAVIEVTEGGPGSPWYLRDISSLAGYVGAYATGFPATDERWFRVTLMEALSPTPIARLRTES
jgi:4'-phosphopantetheinyl transferase